MTWPERSETRPEIALSSVVLPAPLAPTIPRHWSSMRNETSSTARTPPKATVADCTSSMTPPGGAMLGGGHRWGQLVHGRGMQVAAPGPAADQLPGARARPPVPLDVEPGGDAFEPDRSEKHGEDEYAAIHDARVVLE